MGPTSSSTLGGIIVALALLASPARAQEAQDLLPDLDPSAPGKPSAIAASDGSGRIYLTFGTVVANVGAGPLLLSGSRASGADPLMTVDQIVQRTDGGTRALPAVGAFEYDTEYQRWGFAPYLSYELRRAEDYSLVGTGPQIGFCVRDDVNADSATTLPGEPPSATLVGCGKQSSILALQEGISVGWANRHAARRKGQLIDIGSLPTGTYVLVHRANALGLVQETSTGNNASSALLKLTWIAGEPLPKVKTLRRCADTETC
ncbi:MAG: hypothetical protein IT201_04885 [Thermoleophilia bacterium]|nr:hypothetical protein [Thermoleophilia bacterium]